MFPLRLVVSLHPESPQVAHREPQVRTLGDLPGKQVRGGHQGEDQAR
jgi:TRAP-type uncharacterized transport system substrate-binding protein